MVQLNFYVQGNTFLHRLYPLTKIALLIDALIISFVFNNPIISLILAAIGLAAAALSGSEVLKSVNRALVLIMPAIAAILMFQTFFEITFPARPIPFGPLTLHLGGIYYGGLVASRILMAIIVGVTLIVVTHPGDLFVSLQKIKVPYIVGFMVMTMLQYVPILLTESSIIAQAQQSRGIKPSGFGAILPNFAPLFVISWQRAQTLAMVLEVRGVGAPGKKSSFRMIRAKWIDLIVAGVVSVATAYLFVYAATNNFLDWKATYQIAPIVAFAIGMASLVGFFAAMAKAVTAYRA